MREIVNSNGQIYARISVDQNQLRIQLNQSPGQPTVVMDAKVIPQLRQILTEAEFFKNV